LISVNTERCKRDGICVEICPIGILVLDPASGPKTRSGMGQFCIECGHCVAVCPHAALDNVRNPLARQAEVGRYPVLEADDALAFLRSRRSIRCYKDDPVPKEQTLRLLQAARYAPSGHNSQGIEYLVVQGKATLDKVREIVVEWMRDTVLHNEALARALHLAGIIKAHERGEDRILRGAPQLIVATAPGELRAAQVSTYLALEYVELYAATLGMGTCWAGFTHICSQQTPALSKFLRIREDWMITGIMMVGYPQYAYYRLPERNQLAVSWFDESVDAEQREA
jgi:nitroreductase/NAD-dependent dihydropyrimidine dehydrogenase PreA subunit